jgi:DUF3040 family protein
MALTEYEERVIAELEAQLRLDDTVARDPMWFTRFDASASRVPHRSRGRLALLLACFLGGIALWVAGGHAWFAVEMSNVSGLSSSSITRALGVVGCATALWSALMLWRLVRVPHHPR